MWGATNNIYSCVMGDGFQSTLPVWGATYYYIVVLLRYRISIHAPRVGSDSSWHGFGRSFKISIHAPRVGSDHIVLIVSKGTYNFNPRSPCGERRQLYGGGCYCGDFNPRSPCGERPKDLHTMAQTTDFNPRSPCGERRLLSKPLPVVL